MDPNKRKELIELHSPKGVARFLDGVFEYRQVKSGDFKKGEGDIVVIGLKENSDVDFNEYMRNNHATLKIETKGIFTNIFWEPDYFGMVVAEIIK